MKEPNHLRVRKAIKNRKLLHYEVAHEAGISAYTLSVWLRYELTEERYKRLMDAIHRLSS